MTTLALLPLNERPHALYRFYAADGELLYIGITASLPTRIGDHRSDKPWWTKVADIKVEHFGDREAVLVAEAVAIRTERPTWNVTHNRAAGSPTSTITPTLDRRLVEHATLGRPPRARVYDLRTDIGQKWSPRRIWIWCDTRATVQLDRDSYVDWLGERAAISAKLAVVAGACLQEGLNFTRSGGGWRLCPVDLEPSNRRISLAVPLERIGEAVIALLAAELDGDLDPMRFLSGALTGLACR